MQNMLRNTLEFVRERMNEYYDKHRLEGPRLEEGDKVFLLIRNLKIKRLSRKLDFKKIGLFKIARKISTLNYELDLLEIIRLKIKVFYISLLKLIPENVKFETYVKAEDNED